MLLIVAGVFSLAYSKGTLFKGQLMGDQGKEAVIEEKTPLPDLEADIALTSQPKAGEDLNLRATVKNLGPGAVNGKTPFQYAIFINGKEVFSNTDSYTVMSAGDSFSFDYPASREINGYPDKGTVTFSVDTENSLKEVNKGNNKKEIQYSY